MSDDAPEEDAQKAEATAEEPRPKRRRKRRVDTDDAPEARREAEEPAPALPADDEGPAFARHFPKDPALDALVAAFEAGDHARVRREAPALAKSTTNDEVRAAARELRRRLEPDPLAVYLLGIAAVLLVFLAGWYGMHTHGR